MWARKVEGVSGVRRSNTVLHSGAQMKCCRIVRRMLALLAVVAGIAAAQNVPLPSGPSSQPGNNTPQYSDESASAEATSSDDNAQLPQTASPAGAGRQALDDAWWTGPLLAPNASTLPRGHFLIEPYLYDVIGTHSNGFGSLTYINYGLVNRFTVGVIPTFGYNKLSTGLSSAGIGLGDVTVQGQFRLRQFHEGSWLPTISATVQETFPTGKYDHLGDRPSDGLGGGAFTTTVAIYTQTYFWMPNGRILRLRFNVSQAFSREVSVEGVSVYGTGADFRGHADPGTSSLVDASWEYSVTRRWVLALDATYRYTANTRVVGNNTSEPSGVQNPDSVLVNLGSAETSGFAPAVEYCWKSTIGVIVGTRVIPGGHNTPMTITPVIAINIVH
jgi:hypothetical protein